MTCSPGVGLDLLARDAVGTALDCPRVCLGPLCRTPVGLRVCPGPVGSSPGRNTAADCLGWVAGGGGGGAEGCPCGFVKRCFLEGGC